MWFHLLPFCHHHPPPQVDDNQVTAEDYMEEDAAKDESTSNQPEDTSEIPKTDMKIESKKTILYGGKRLHCTRMAGLLDQLCISTKC